MADGNRRDHIADGYRDFAIAGGVVSFVLVFAGAALAGLAGAIAGAVIASPFLYVMFDAAHRIDRSNKDG